MQKQMQAALAEFLGTFFLIYFGCGSIVIDHDYEGILGLPGIALCFGFLVMAIVYALGHVSGAHINPAVTITLASMRKFPWINVPSYIVAQCLGSIVAAFALKVTISEGASLGMTFPAGDPGQAFFLEVIMTAFLLFVVASLGTDARAPSHFTGMVVGVVIAAIVFVGGPISGASMNPARSLGPAIAMGNFDHLWLYLVAPIVGGLIGGLLYSALAPIKDDG